MATNLNALVMKISADTSGLAAGVKLTRSEIGRLNRIQQMAKTDADRLRESTETLQKAHAAGAINAVQLAKSVDAINKRYATNTKATDKNAEAIKRAQALVKSTVPAIDSLKAQFRDLMVAERAGKISTEEFARAKQHLIEKTKALHRAQWEQSEAGKRAANAAKGYREHLRKLVVEQDNAARSSSGLTTRLKAVVAGYLGLQAIKSIATTAMEIENATVAMEVFTGSAKRGQKMVRDMRDLAASTPLNFGGLAKAGQMMLSFGVDAKRIMPNLRALGEISGGNEERFHSLALAFSQISATGHLMGQDLNQLKNAGFNPLKEIADHTGRSMGELIKDMSDGRISFKDVETSMRRATSAGGLFAGLMDRYSKTSAGALALMRSEAQGLATDMWEKVSPGVASFANSMRSVIASVRSFGQSMTQPRARMLAFVGGFSAGVLIIPKLVKAIATITTTIRTMTRAQIVAMAVSGPKGWAVVAAGLAAAGAAVYAVDRAFDSYNETLDETREQVAETTNEIEKSSVAIAATAEQIQAIENERTKDARAYLDNLKEQNLELSMGAEWLAEYRAFQHGSTEAQKNELKELKARNEHLKKHAEWEKKRNELVEQRIKRRKEEIAKIVEAGDAHENSLINPVRKLARDLAEIDAARYRGEINQDQADNARAAKESEFRKNAQADKPIKVELPPAVQRGSREEYQAIASIFSQNRAREEQRHRENLDVWRANVAATREVSEVLRGLSTTEAV